MDLPPTVKSAKAAALNAATNVARAASRHAVLGLEAIATTSVQPTMAAISALRVADCASVKLAIPITTTPHCNVMAFAAKSNTAVVSTSAATAPSSFGLAASPNARNEPSARE